MRQLTCQNEALYDRTNVMDSHRSEFAAQLALVGEQNAARYERWNELLLAYLQPRFPSIASHLLAHLLELVGSATRSMHWHTLANVDKSGIGDVLAKACKARQMMFYVDAMVVDMELRQLQDMLVRLPVESAEAAKQWEVFKASETVYHKAAHFIPGSYHLDPPVFQDLPVWPLDFNRATLLPRAGDCRLEVLTKFVSLTSPSSMLHRQSEHGVHPLRSLVEGLLHLMLEVKIAHDTDLVRTELEYREPLAKRVISYKHNNLYRHPLLNHLGRNLHKLHEYTPTEHESLIKLASKVCGPYV